MTPQERPKTEMYLGPPCKHGHGVAFGGALRYVIGGSCVPCSRGRSRKVWVNRGEKWRQQRRERYATEGGRTDRRARNLRQNYGITLAQYEAMARAQNFRCDICGDEGKEQRAQRLDVDHCHTTGKNRSLLCHKCNIGLGSFLDDPERLAKAIAYLKKHGA